MNEILEDSLFQEIMEESLNDVTGQIDVFMQFPDKVPNTFLVSYAETDNQKTKDKKAFIAIVNYYIGSFESLVRTRLHRKHNLVLTATNQEDYLRNLSPFFDSLKTQLGKINDDIIEKAFTKLKYID